MAPYRILSMDGGGIRGALTIRVIERLDQMVPNWLEKVDLFAGTSTGGILALVLAAGLKPTFVREMFEKLGKDVFADSLLDDIKDAGKIFGADYSLKPLYQMFIDHLGDICLGDLKKRVLISTFDLDNGVDLPGRPRSWKAKFFHNYPGPDSDSQARVADVGAMTSAAPTFFPIYQGFIDGGVVATNPSMCAVAQALHKETGRQRLRDVHLLSLGTGCNSAYITEDNGDWGLAQWAPHLVGMMLDGGGNLADYQCRQVLGPRYLRVNPPLHRNVEMDDVKSTAFLLQVADLENLTETAGWLRSNFMREREAANPSVPDAPVS
jgi:patatin-like phospholipase/acyl hydrolase